MANASLFGGIALMCLLATSFAADFEDCGSKVGNFTEIKIPGCGPSSKSCILRRGTNTSIGITFFAKKPVTKVSALVWGRIADIDVPFPLPNPDGCESGVSCPLKPNLIYNYQTTLPVLKIYPKIQLIVKWELVDEENKPLVCALIPASIR